MDKHEALKHFQDAFGDKASLSRDSIVLGPIEDVSQFEYFLRRRYRRLEWRNSVDTVSPTAEDIAHRLRILLNRGPNAALVLPYDEYLNGRTASEFEVPVGVRHLMPNEIKVPKHNIDIEEAALSDETLPAVIDVLRALPQLAATACNGRQRQ